MDFVQRFSGVPAGSLLRRSEVAAPSGGLDWKGHLPHGKISPPAFPQDAQGRAHRRNPAGNLHSAGKLSNFSGRSASGLPHLLLALVCAAYFLGISDSRLTLSGNRKPKGLPQACSLRPVRCQNTALMLVGRDTQSLSEEEVTKACVETVAENTSDGVTAPLFYLLIGGVPLGFLYKAVNTLDSMVGYRNETYRYFGTVSAKLDDALNWLPSRICAVLMICAAWLLRLDARNAWRIFRRDRSKHLSPNSAQTESVAAGALGIRLGGTHLYFGKPVKKPTIGDARRPARPEDILTANRLMIGTSILSALGFGAVRFLIVFGMR